MHKRTMAWLAAGAIGLLAIPDWFGAVGGSAYQDDPEGVFVTRTRAVVGFVGLAAITVMAGGFGAVVDDLSAGLSGLANRFRTTMTTTTTTTITEPIDIDANDPKTEEPKETTKQPIGDAFVVVIGHAGNGKDTLCDYLVNKYGFSKTAFADPLKMAVAAMFGFSTDQMYDQVLKDQIDDRWQITPRQAVNFVGTELVRDHIDRLLPGIGAGFWIKRLQLHRQASIDKTEPTGSCYSTVPRSSYYRLAVPDGRFPNEIAAAKTDGAVIVRVVRPGHTSSAPAHASVSAIDQIPADQIDVDIVNDGSVQDFYDKIDRLLVPRLRLHVC